MSQNSVIIVAGGSGTRMNQSLPKQFALVHGMPVLVHTILAFLSFDKEIQIILVLPKNHLQSWSDIKQNFLPNTRIEAVVGGKTRYQSVENGLSAVTGTYVAIHDAVRPCVTPETINESFLSAQEYGSGVVCVPLKDSIRSVDGEKSSAADRNLYQVVQTPQTFSTSEIKKAFNSDELSVFTDDASVYEYVLKKQVNLVMGDYRNIKITTPEDLEIVGLFLGNKKPWI